MLLYTVQKKIIKKIKVIIKSHRLCKIKNACKNTIFIDKRNQSHINFKRHDEKLKKKIE